MKKNIRLLVICVVVLALIVLSIPPKKPKSKDIIIRAQLTDAGKGLYVDPAGYYEGGVKLIDPKTSTEYSAFLCVKEWQPLTVGSYYDLNLSEIERAHNSHSAENSGCYLGNLALSSKQ